MSNFLLINIFDEHYNIGDDIYIFIIKENILLYFKINTLGINKKHVRRKKNTNEKTRLEPN